MRQAQSPEDARHLAEPISATIRGAHIDQLQLCPEAVSQVARTLAEKARPAEDAFAVPVLEQMQRRIADGYAGLTGASAALLREYIRLERLGQAGELLAAIDVLSTVFPAYVVNVFDVLEFLFDAGALYIRMGRRAEALNAYETVCCSATCVWLTRQCVALPTEVVHSLQTHAFKKLVLLRLVRDGHVPQVDVLLRSASATVRSTYVRECADAYLALADAYQARRPSCAPEVQALVERHTAQYENDGNMPLVQQCVALQRRRWIQTLASVYSTLTLRDIAAYTGMPDTPDVDDAAEREVQAMIADGWVRAEIQPAPAPAAAPNDTHVPLPGCTTTLPANPGSKRVRFIRAAPENDEKLRTVLVNTLVGERQAAERLAEQQQALSRAPQVLSKVGGERRRSALTHQVWSVHAGPGVAAPMDDEALDDGRSPHGPSPLIAAMHESAPE